MGPCPIRSPNRPESYGNCIKEIELIPVRRHKILSPVFRARIGSRWFSERARAGNPERMIAPKRESGSRNALSGGNAGPLCLNVLVVLGATQPIRAEVASHKTGSASRSRASYVFAIVTS